MKTEKSAKGVRGFLLYSPHTKEHFFRVYHHTIVDGKPVVPPGLPPFTDYRVTAEDIEVELVSDFNALYEADGVEGETYNRLDFSSKVLGRKSPNEQSDPEIPD